MTFRRAALLFWLIVPQAGWTAPPRINGINPPALQRGEETTLQLYGKELSGTAELLVPFPAEVRHAGGGGESFQVTVKPSAETAPGVYPVRLRTAGGISNLRLLVVADVPVVRVKEPNGRYINGKLDLDQAQPITWPCLIAGGRLERDIDAFRLLAKPRERLTLVTQTWQVGLTPDPLLRLRDRQGRILAYAHDTPTLQRDERLDVTLAHDGPHYLELQSTGGGGWNNHYLVRVDSCDYARTVFPLGGRRGEKVRFQILNRDGQASTLEAIVPADPHSTDWRLPLPEHPGSLPWPLASGDYPELHEAADHTTPQLLTWPVTVNGRISRPGEDDRYRIAVQPGQTIRVRVEAFYQGSALDGYLMVYDPVGKKLLARHDDEVYRGHPDPCLDFEVPADLKEVTISLRDTLNQGSELHSYRLIVEQGGPDFLLWLGQKQQVTNEEDVGWHRMDASDTLNLPIGEEARLRLSVRRSRKDHPHYNGPILGYDGPISVTVSDLPLGVTARPLVIPAGATEAELLITADAQAPRTPFELVIVGTGTRADGTTFRRIAERRLYLSDPALPNMPWNWRVQKVTCVTTASPASK